MRSRGGHLCLCDKPSKVAQKSHPYVLVNGPMVSAATGTNKCDWITEEYLHIIYYYHFFYFIVHYSLACIIVLCRRVMLACYHFR